MHGFVITKKAIPKHEFLAFLCVVNFFLLILMHFCFRFLHFFFVQSTYLTFIFILRVRTGNKGSEKERGITGDTQLTSNPNY